jgi:hypothetical protein
VLSCTPDVEFRLREDATVSSTGGQGVTISSTAASGGGCGGSSGEDVVCSAEAISAVVSKVFGQQRGAAGSGGEGGDAGAGGSSVDPSTACWSCMAGECCDELKGCDSLEGCFGHLKCIFNCGDPAKNPEDSLSECFANCDEYYCSAKNTSQNVFGCLSPKSCPSECIEVLRTCIDAKNLTEEAFAVNSTRCESCLHKQCCGVYDPPSGKTKGGPIATCMAKESMTVSPKSCVACINAQGEGEACADDEVLARAKSVMDCRDAKGAFAGQQACSEYCEGAIYSAIDPLPSSAP